MAGFKRGTEKNPHQSGIEINYCLVDYKNEDEFIDRLIELAEYYMDNLQYEINPSWGGGYNSNSFIHGLLNAAHGKYSRPPVNVTGWEQPVPSEAFGVRVGEGH